MSSLSLIQSKTELLQTMSESDQAKYFKLMQLWFQQKINKVTYDSEITKLLNKTQNELHKKFILIFLHKHVTFSKHKYLNTNSEVSRAVKQEIPSHSSVQAPSHSSLQTPSHSSLQTPSHSNVQAPSHSSAQAHNHSSAQAHSHSSGVEGPSDMIGHVDKKVKVAHTEYKEYYFEPADLYTMIPSTQADHESESLLNRNSDSYLMGLLQISAWQQGLPGGAPNKEICALVQYAVNTFIKNLITTIVVKKKSFKLKGNNFICDIGKHVPNPWLKSSHIYRTEQSTRYPLLKFKNYLSEKRSLLKNENFQTAMDVANSIKFNSVDKKPSNSISLQEVLYVIMNNTNDVIPMKDLQYTLYENILPLKTPAP